MSRTTVTMAALAVVVFGVGAWLTAAESSSPVTAVMPTTFPAATAERSALQKDVQALCEDIEAVRMLLGAVMWQTHDLRNFTLYAEPGEAAWKEMSHLEEADRESLRLYEAIKPLDFAATSLRMAVDIGDMDGATEDLAFIREELSTVAGEVAAWFHAVTKQRNSLWESLRARASKSGMELSTVDPMPWDNPLRERQRQRGVQLGWRTMMEPPADFRESLWNAGQEMGIGYKLDKGRMLGVTYLTFKDPVLRWDNIEREKGKYDFAALDRMMKMAVDRGYKVRLYLPVMGGRVPDWMVAERAESVVRDDKGEYTFAVGNAYDHDFMGPSPQRSPWHEYRVVNLSDKPTREAFEKYVKAVGEHIVTGPYKDAVLSVGLDLFYAERYWRAPAGQDKKAFVTSQYAAAAGVARPAFSPIPVSLEVADGEAHSINTDFSAMEWRSVGLTRAIGGIPEVCSETPFYEDLMRAVAMEAGGKEGQPGPFFHQNCEYGFGSMNSVNFFTSLLRDGLTSEGWFGPEGILRWGYFPQIFAWNDRQTQWSGITNGYLAFEQAWKLGPTIANTRVSPADVLLVLPSSSFEVKGFHTNRELVGWGWVLTALKIPYDVLTEAGLSAGVPSRAKLVILPQAVVLNDAQVKAIRSFVEGGGLLVCSTVPGTDGGKASPLADVIGCDLLRKDGQPVGLMQTGVKGTWLQLTMPHGMHSGKYQPVPRPDEGYPRTPKNRETRDGHYGAITMEGMSQPFQALAARDGATVVHTYLEGEAAVVANTFGKGKTLTLGYPYGNEIMFADWTSIAFGKIYNGWARDEQMLGMVAWARDALAGLGYSPSQSVPEAWRHRLQGWEAAASSLSFPRGPSLADNPWVYTYTYLDPREAHRIPRDHDVMDYAAELTWRDREGVATRYLAVGNREAAYAAERAHVQFWVMPHIFRVRIDDPKVKWVYDVAAGAPVMELTRDEKGVSFLTSVPPAMGRVFAVSHSDTVELFEADGPSPAVTFDTLLKRVEAVRGEGKKGERGPAGVVLHEASVKAWLASKKGQKLTVCYGDASYKAVAETLAAWLVKQGIEAVASGEDGEFTGAKAAADFQVNFTPSDAAILIGSAWSNNTIASQDSGWPYNNTQCPQLASARLTATYAWPHAGQGIVALTRAKELRGPNDRPFGESYNNVEGYWPQDVDAARRGYQQRKLLILASTPKGAARAVAVLTGE